MERRNRELETDLNKASREYKVVTDKGKEYREADGKLQQLELEYRALEMKYKVGDE